MSKPLAYIATGVFILAIIGASAYWLLPSQTTSQPQTPMTQMPAATYMCPMHPQIIDDKPGNCPICGMNLVEAETHDYQSHAPQTTNKKVLYWYDPMKPGTHFDKPGKSPFMDMDLVPKYAEETPAASASGGITVSAQNIQKMNVRTTPVSKSSLSGDIRASGIVTENERERVELFSQIEGRVDSLAYDALGDEVEKDAVFYTLYSPELYALQSDYIAASKSEYDDLARAARKRMELLGISKATLNAIVKRDKPIEAIPFYSPAKGIVQRLDVREGTYIQANQPIAVIQDLSSVWIDAELPERDVSRIKAGDVAQVIMASGNAREAVVDYVYPTVTEATRTGRARLVMDNADYALLPSSYVTVTFAATGEEVLTIPSSAILRSSKGQHVIVALPDNRFEPRSIKTGRISGGQTEILEGLQEGENVVTNGQFLIDSESNLQESLATMSGGDDAAQ